MAERKLPQNIEAEMSVLGVAFLNKNALVKICEELYSDMFYSDANKKLLKIINYTRCYSAVITASCVQKKQRVKPYKPKKGKIR